MRSQSATVRLGPRVEALESRRLLNGVAPSVIVNGGYGGGYPGGWGGGFTSVGVPSPELVCQLKRTSDDVVVPGEVLRVTVVVTNTGSDRAKGPLLTEIRLDGITSPAASLTRNISLRPGKSVAMKFRIPITAAVPAGEHTLQAEVNEDGAIWEYIGGDHLDTAPLCVRWEAGDVDGRRRAMVFADSDGDRVRTSLSNGGTVALSGDDPRQLSVSGTSARSVLRIRVRKSAAGDGRVQFGRLSCDGLMRAVVAPAAHFAPDPSAYGGSAVAFAIGSRGIPADSVADSKLLTGTARGLL